MDGPVGVPIRLLMLCAVLAPATIAHASRQRHALERYATDDLKYWSYASNECGPAAFVIDPDGYLHRVAVGDYMGNAYGKIIAITATSIRLVEVHGDGDGGWHERPYSLGPPTHDDSAPGPDATHAVMPGCDAPPIPGPP